MRKLLLPVAISMILVALGCSDSGTGPGERQPDPIATSISLAGGDGQSGTAGAALPDPIRVKILDQRGQPLSGVSVSWATTTGAGSFSPASSSTNSSGEAAANWTLGTSAGTNTARATAGNLAPVEFTATGAPGAAASIKVTPDSVTLKAGETQQFTAESKDQYGNIVTPELTWTSSDTAAAKLNNTGLASAAVARTTTITAAVQGVSGTAVLVVAPGPPANLTLQAGDGQTLLAGTGGDSIVIRVTDAYTNGVKGIEVSWGVDAGGGTASPALSVTDSTGVVKTLWTLGRHAGHNAMTAASASLSGSQLGVTATATPNGTISGTVSIGAASASRSFAQSLSARATEWNADRVAADVSRSSIAPPGAAPKVSYSVGTADLEPPRRLIVRYRAEAVGVGRGAIGTLAVRASGVSEHIRERLTERSSDLAFSIEGVSPMVLAARIEVADPSRIEEVRSALRRDPAVLSVEQDHWAHATTDGPVVRVNGTRNVPADPGYEWQAWHYGAVDLPRAWATTTGSSQVVVAVVDDGIRFDHPSISTNLTSDGYDFVSQQVTSICGVQADNSGDGDGYDSDPTVPANYNCSTASLASAGGHGLHVAGTIGAVGGDDNPFVGVNWAVKIRPVRVLGVGGSGSHYDIAQGILYAAGLPADNGIGGTVTAPSRAQIINLSLGGANTSATLEDAVNAASAAGSLLVAAAGNENTSEPGYPAAYPATLSVSSVSPYLQKASYSNYGSTVDIAGPGGEMEFGITHGIASTVWNFVDSEPAHWFMQGTSMAAPHVTGIAALILGREPTLSAADLRARLLEYAVDLGPAGRDDQFGAGLVNARNSVTATMAPASELFVQLYDARTGAIVRTGAAPGGQFALHELPDGEYYIFAGSDEEGDQQIGVPGRRWGGFTQNGSLSSLTIDGAGVYPANFGIGLPSEVEPNEQATNATMLPVGGYVHAYFDGGSDVDMYRIRVPTGQYLFETSAWLDGACGFAHGADTVLELLREDGSAVAMNDDGPGVFNYCSRISTGLEGGTYLIRVTGTDGAYRLRVRSGS